MHAKLLGVVLSAAAEGEGLDLLSHVEFQRNYR
jgi:hypothetical protein